MTTQGPGRIESAERLNDAIARRCTALRKGRQLSFDEVAARSGISKGMLVQIEQGRANPSIATLCKLAASLRVSVPDLLAVEEATKSPLQLVAARAAPILWRGPKGGLASLLVAAEGPDMLELWEWSLMPGERYEAKPHPPDTLELLHVLEGSLILEVAGVSHAVGAGASARAYTDRPHSYACGGRRRTRFMMVASEPAAPSDRHTTSQLRKA